ncbi:hypothetical protein CMI43_01465 [Candidatus Pacearchaeota archaeon]|jgi:hypothetical protein|nr:hypothetical protein [Candidatus Pacearchaeota archaeon]|tara:strand:- start:205 stop:894 length:690 start_codon:yes stop_codon:yes gene_type:complete
MKIGNKKIISSIFIIVLTLSFISSIYAITGSIGNARMILRPEIGDSIERSILVKNINDIAVDIELSVTGDLVEDIKIKNNKFRLNAGEEKKALFTIDVRNSGTTETKINVKFAPIDGGNGVGLSSTIIVIPEEGNKDAGSIFDIFKDDEKVVEGEKVNGEVSVGKNKDKSALGSEESENKNMGLTILGGTFTIILFISLLILLTIASKHLKKINSEKLIPIKPKKSLDE